MTKKKQQIDEEIEKVEEVDPASLEPNPSEAPTEPVEVVSIPDEEEPEDAVNEEEPKEKEPKPKIELHGTSVIDLSDSENVLVYGGPVRANLGKVTLKAAKAWLDERSWEVVEAE